MQRLLHMLDPLGTCGVRLVLLSEVIEIDTPTLASAIADAFFHLPLDALSDAIWLAHAFDHEARTVRGSDPSRADRISMQATRLQHIACGLLRTLTRADETLIDALLADSRASSGQPQPYDPSP